MKFCNNGNEQQDNRDAYHHLYKSVREFHKQIARRYDYMTGSKYMLILIAQLMDGLISKGDPEDMNPPVRNAIITASKL